MRQPRRVVETSAMTPDRHAGEDELVRANLHLATQAVHELARRLPTHVNRDDLSSAGLLGPAPSAPPPPPPAAPCGTSCATRTGPAARSAPGPGGSSRPERT